MPEIKRSINMDHIKIHYFTSHPKLNADAIVPVGPKLDFSAPHDRRRFAPPGLAQCLLYLVAGAAAIAFLKSRLHRG